MSKIKVAELFYSLQGEGFHMGVPSVFLRTFGCNFSCAGFGMPKGQRSTEHLEVDPKLYDSYESLPLVSTGCDSYASWDVRFKKLSPMMHTDDIADSIIELLPYKAFYNEHLVITGGEPLLGWQRAYPALIDNMKLASLEYITFETNGTQELEKDVFNHLSVDHDLTFSVSPKLSVSGESWEDAIRPAVVSSYQYYSDNVYLKFVIASEEDANEADRAVEDYRKAGFRGHVYFMPVGGVESVYHLNNRRVAELALARGVRYSDRLQVPLFKNAWGT